MHIQVTLRHESLNHGTREFAENELQTHVLRYEPQSAEVVLDHEGNGGKVKIAEITLKVKGDVLVVRETSEDIRKSISLAVKTLESRLHKHKELHVKTGPLKRHIAEPKGIFEG